MNDTRKYLSLLSICYLSTASSLGLASEPASVLIGYKNPPLQPGKTSGEQDSWETIYQVAVQKLNNEAIERDKGFYSQSDAARYLKEALEEARKYGDEDRRVADILMLQGKLKELGHNMSTDEYAGALAIREKVYGPDSPEVAEALDRLGETYAWRRKYAEATACFYRSLAIIEHNNGKGASMLSQSINKACERGFATAGDTRRLLRKILDYLEHSPDQAAKAQILNAMTYTGQRNTYPAVPLSEQVEAAREAIAIQEKIAGGKNLILANYLESLARLYAEQRQYAEAVDTYRRVLSIRDYAAMYNTHLLNKSYNTMAGYLQLENKLDEAEKYKKMALAMWQKAPGDSYINVLNALNSIAYFYESTGKDDKAVLYYKEADDMLTKENPRQISSTEKLAKLYMKVGRYGEAESLLKRCLAQRSEGGKVRDNYDCISYLEMLGVVATKLGKYADARGYFDQVKEYYDQGKFAWFGRGKYPKDFLQAYVEYLQKSGQQTEYLAYKAKLDQLIADEQYRCPACGRG
jgi:tetratricopeptide (TPR) repeat protein